MCLSATFTRLIYCRSETISHASQRRVNSRGPDRQVDEPSTQVLTFLIKIEATEIYFQGCTCFFFFLIRHSAGHSEMWLQPSDTAPTVLMICHLGQTHSISGVHTHARVYFRSTARRNDLKPFGGWGSRRRKAPRENWIFS